MYCIKKSFLNCAGCFLCFLLMSFSAFAQVKKITGTLISSDDNKKLSGVSIQVKGKGAGTSTNDNGEFTIEAQNGDTLLFTYVGYEKSEYALNGENNIEITLQPLN